MSSSRIRPGLAACLFGAALCSAASVQADETRIYKSTDASGRPVFSDRPLNRSSKVYAMFDGTHLWPRSGTGPISLPQLSVRRTSVEPIVQRIAQSHGVNAALLKAIIEVESGFNANALSPKGAVGLMQVMPATAARYGRFDLYSPEQNVDVGARYLRDLLAMFDGNVRLAVAAYNAGENAVIRHGRRVPPYQETIKYVPMVLERYDRFRAAATY
ncbi:lytic transglycosylase domain-containing protein [Noviherbaspirillum sp. ST9]|uniref:lytic transglycosylase domain-containing protein n=1 Tax=Noviherbaspirillum sp. ST9 TaxID=3401606 RepID=UPI003B5885BF